jgi:hypothetical protein
MVVTSERQARSVIVLVTVVVTAAAAGTVLIVMGMIVVMVVIVLVVMRMIMRMVMMIMAVRVSMGVAMALGVAVAMTMMVVMAMIVVADMGAALRPERALHRGRRAALPAHEFRYGRIVLHIESIRRDLDQAMAAAEMPGEAREAQGVLGLHLQERLGRRLDLDEPTVLEPQGIAVVNRRLHVEIEQDLGPALSLEHPLAAVAGLVIEGDRVGDAVGLHGGLADDGGDAGHGLVSVNVGEAQIGSVAGY